LKFGCKIKNYMKLILPLFLFIISFNSYAQNAKDNFSVVIEGTRSHLDYIKARSELTMARSTKFCRGAKMPKSVGEWSCKNTAPRMSNCVLEYKCNFVSKKFNRLSESRRLRAKLEAIPHLKSNYTISLLYKDKKQVLEEINNYSAKPSPSKKVVASNFSSQQLKKSKSPSKHRVSKVRPKPTKRIKLVKKKTKYKKIKIKDKPKPKANAKEDLEELAFLKEDSKEEVRPTEVVPLKDEKVVEQINFETKYDLMNFSISFISISDNNETSLKTFGLAWTPGIWFTQHFGVRGQFGFHAYKTTETELLESQSFLIYDIAAYGQYLFTNIFLEMGYGIQKWNVEGAEGVSSLSFGAGYLFDDDMPYILDRVSVELSSLSNEVSTKELKLNIGASF